MSYTIYLVPNGSRTDFVVRHIATHECHVWGIFESLDDATERFVELAKENFCREEGPWDEIWGQNMDFDAAIDAADEERRREAADRIAQAALDKYVNSCLDSKTIEWHDDLKWVCIARTDDDGNIIDVE